MNHLIIGGSVRSEGKSTALSHALAARLHELDPEADVALFDLADDIDVDACLACDFCKLGEGCVIDDPMQDLYGLLDAADELIVVSPIYFAGPPARFKAVLDRMQLYFWTDFRTKPKRPAELFAIGDGGDPHGYEPLVGTVRSAFSVAGFAVEQVHGCIGMSMDEIESAAKAWRSADGASA